MAKERHEYKINWKTLRNIRSFDAEYDMERDILLLQSKKRCPAISIDVDGEMWFRVDPSTGEIVGLEIEDFREVFLKKHPEILGESAILVKPVANFISEQRARCPV